MCNGTATYYVRCGHSAIVWRRCEYPRSAFCRMSQAGEEYRDEMCRHRWCPCDGSLWACCRCMGLNRWSDCGSCRHVKCQLCGSGINAEQWGVPNYEDPRYVQWRRHYLRQEQERASRNR
ncbi:hypothetical protein F5Y10DRAFT_55555, partial [Nemania abortiva]